MAHKWNMAKEIKILSQDIREIDYLSRQIINTIKKKEKLN